jgi:2,5-diketo-D-gluconate reductase A
MSDQPSVTLDNGVRIPQLGFGVYRIPPDDTADAVRRALGAGYRHVDTAAMYGNEKGVGRAVRESGIPREEVFVTTKLNNPDHIGGDIAGAFAASRRRLGLDVVDLYLVHWPLPAHDRYVEAWRAMEKLLRDGAVRAIGVSNFQPAHLERLAAETGTVPALNQVELHPYLTQDRVRAYDAEHRIATEAWGPLARGRALTDPAITALAEKYGRTPAQIVLRWHLQLGNVVIPKSVTPARIAENAAIFDFELDPDDVAAISGLNRDERTGPDPDTFNP